MINRFFNRHDYSENVYGISPDFGQLRNHLGEALIF